MPLASDVWRSTEKRVLGVPVERTMRMLFGDPFMIYRTYMLPTLANGMLKHPIRNAGVLGVLGILSRAIGGDDDEAIEALAGQPGAEGMPLSADAEAIAAEYMEPIREGLKKFGGDFGWLPDLDGKMRKYGGDWYKGLVEAAGNLPKRAVQMEPFTFKAPSAPGETRISSLEDFAPLAGMGLDAARAVRGSGASFAQDPVRGATEAVSALYGQVPNTLIGAALSGLRIMAGQSGKPRDQVMVEEFQKFARQALPLGSPAWALSPTAIKGHEVLNLKGQTFLDKVKGLQRVVRDPESRAVSAFLFGEAWRSRRVPAGNTARSFKEPLINHVFNVDEGVGSTPKSDVVSEARQVARRRVLDQVSTLVVDAYENHRRGLYGRVSFDQSLYTELGLTEDLHRKPDGRIGVNKNPKTSLGKFLSAQSEDVREVAIEDASNLLIKMTSGPAMFAAVEMGRRGHVEPPVFRRVFTAALRDPGGEGLVRFMSNELGLKRTDSGVQATGNTADMAAYYSLFVNLLPDRGSMSQVGQEHYDRVMGFFGPKSMGDPAFPDGGVRSILGSKAFDLAPLQAIK